MSAERIYNLMKLDVLLQKKRLLTNSAFILLVLVIFPMQMLLSGSAYAVILFVGGFVWTVTLFKDVHRPQTSYLYLTLPSSTFEKLFSRWLLVAIVYPVILLAFCYIVTLLFTVFYRLAFHNPVPFVNPVTLNTSIVIGKYIILQSVMLLGAIFFKRQQLIKTLLSVGVLAIFVGMLILFVAWVASPYGLPGNMINITVRSFNGLYFIFWIIVAPFCWYLSYQRLKECEI